MKSEKEIARILLEMKQHQTTVENERKKSEEDKLILEKLIDAVRKRGGVDNISEGLSEFLSSLDAQFADWDKNSKN